MIVVTGAAGFIGSNIVRKLNSIGREDIVAADVDLARNLSGAKIYTPIHKDMLLEWLYRNHSKVTSVIHMGARTDTTDADRDGMMEDNYEYTKALWLFCSLYDKRLVYASSAATYGDGSSGFDDECDLKKLKPLNVYAESKHRFDLLATKKGAALKPPPYWAGLKFFNVYGYGEEHKGKMASMVFQAYKQIKSTKKVKLFNIDSRRDFVYVDDVADIVLHFALKAKNKGIFNVGTGSARSFDDLANAVFKAMNREVFVEYKPLPASLRDKYQTYTCATTKKLRSAGYKKPFTTLESGVAKYVNLLES
jgi:ADP-L-glycero-D-manno-heptose 6-epimerase